jgi:hypothetical protein
MAPDGPADPLREALEKAIGFQYRVERLLGRGGMGAVYLAHELALERDVAIKVLPPEHASAPESRERFKREARTSARFNHPNIVPLYTFGEVSGLMYFVMGYVAGESLSSRLQQGPLDSESARALICALCEALDYAHKQGIVHRDIKPDNILIEGESDTPRLTDFGIVKTIDTDVQLTRAQLTTAGQLVGTPHYMSPEQATGQPDITPASDIYSLGVVAYEVVSGRRPFEGDNPMDVLAQRLIREPRRLSEVATDAPPDLTQAIMRCLERNPSNRWPSARSLRDALMPSEEVVEYSPPLRVLKSIATVAFPIVAIAFVHFRVFARLNPGLKAMDRLSGMFVGALGSMLLVGIVMTIRLRREGMNARSIVRKVFEQPNWWRSWYPRSLRRPGDVWDRLPRGMRQFRTLKGALLAYVFAVYLPASVLYTWQRPALSAVLLTSCFVGIAVMFTLRRTTLRRIKAQTSMTSPRVSELLNTPTWRTSAWRTPHAAMILSGSAAARPGHAVVAPAPHP